ncbi:right-handed parallel beta-helix repeat-containing protein [bacterium]|nr:right-handed parallel beta-helix repeat-containing protein [bacterium]
MKRLFLFILVLSHLTGIVSASILHVPNDFPTIQNAIHQSTSGDTILVAEGTYHEFVRIESHPVTIASSYLFDQNPDHIERTVLAGALDQDGTLKLMNIDLRGTGETRLVGVTFTSDSSIAGTNGNLLVWRNGPGEIRNCRFTRLGTPEYGTALSIFTADRVTIRQTSFIENEYRSIYADRSNFIVDDCRFERNFSAAIYSTKSDLTVQNSTFQHHRSSIGVIAIFNREDVSPEILIEGNVFHQNEVSGLFSAPLFIYKGSNNRVTNNRFTENRSDLGAASGVKVTNAEYVQVDRNLFEGNISYRSTTALELLSHADVNLNIFRNNRGLQYLTCCILSSNLVNPEVHFRRNLFIQNAPLVEGYIPEWAGVLIGYQDATVSVEQCDFVGNVGGGESVISFASDQAEARNNFWGDPSGPYHSTSNPGGLGEIIDLEPEQFLPFSSEHYFLPNLWMRGDAFDIGETLPDQPVTKTLWVTNNGIMDLILYSIGSNNSVFRAVAQFDTLHEGEYGAVDLYFEPTEVGQQSAILSFASNDPFATRDRLEVTGTCSRTLDAAEDNALPDRFSVAPSHPNPFNAETRFSISLPETGELRVRVIDVQGREVAQLTNGMLRAGTHQFSWRAEDVSSGIYFLDVQTSAGKHVVQKLVLIR